MTLLLALAIAFGHEGTSADRRLVARLGDDRAAVRDRSERDLLAAGIRVQRLCNRQATSHPDAEVRRRCRRVAQRLLEEQVQSLGHMPWIDSFWLHTYYANDKLVTQYNPDRVFLGRFAHKHLSAYLKMAGGSDASPYENYRRATELAVRDWINAGVPCWAIEPVLNIMRDRDEAWKQETGWYGPKKTKPDA